MKYHFLKTFVMRGRENARQTCEFVVRFCLAHGKPFFPIRAHANAIPLFLKNLCRARKRKRTTNSTLCRAFFA
jgi:hypothetical protein